MSGWFTIDKIDGDTYIISEYRHWEETHCYLLNGSERSLLIDTGLGICNIFDEVIKPVSYTHLDVYKRQGVNRISKTIWSNFL